MNNYKSILLMKLPYCTHPIFLEKDQDIRTKTTFRPGPSIAIAALCSFFDKYNSYGYILNAGLIKGLPDHIIVILLIGYIYKKLGDNNKCNEYYNIVHKLLKQNNSKNTFYKYFQWNNIIINDYKQYILEHNKE